MTPWTVARQAPLSVGFSRHEYWSGLPFPSPGDVNNPGIEPQFPALTGSFFAAESPGSVNITVFMACMWSPVSLQIGLLINQISLQQQGQCLLFPALRLCK